MAAEHAGGEEGEHDPPMKGCIQMNCNRQLGQDDPHGLCFKCRYGSSGHECNLCKDMGEFSSSNWKKYLLRIDNDKAQIQAKSPKEQYINQEQLDNSFKGFEERMMLMMTNMLGGRAPGSVWPSQSAPTTQVTHSTVCAGNGKPVNTSGASGQARSRSHPQNDSRVVYSGVNTTSPGNELFRKEREQAQKAGPSNSATPEDDARSYYGSKSQAGIDLDYDQEEMDEDEKSGYHDWKRQGHDTDDVSAADSISQVGSDRSQEDSDEVKPVVVEAKDLKDAELYYAAVKEAVRIIPIKGAEDVQADELEIQTSRYKPSKARMDLPLAKVHKKVIDQIWNKKKLDSLSVCNPSALAKYRIVDEDYNKYFKPSTLDSHLKYELGRANKSFKMAKPTLPDKNMNKLDVKMAKTEKQALLSMSTAVSQSWLLQAVSQELKGLKAFLQDNLAPESYEEVMKVHNLDTVSNMVTMSQDAAVEMLDLQAREAANMKQARRQLWLHNTKWSPDVKEMIRTSPVSGDGQLCGDKLVTILDDFKQVNRHLDGTDGLLRIPETVTEVNKYQPAKGQKRQNFSSGSGASGGPVFKKPRLEMKSGYNKPPGEQKKPFKKPKTYQGRSYGGNPAFRDSGK